VKGTKAAAFTMADIVQCPCGSNVRRTLPGQTRCPKCISAGEAPDAGRPREKVDCIRITVPPSLYDLWHTLPDGTKVKTAVYLAWEFENIDHVRDAFWWLSGRVGVFVTVFGGTEFNEARDLDNCFKAAQDIIVSSGCIRDDSVRHIIEIGSRYVDPSTPPTPAYATIRVVALRS